MRKALIVMILCIMSAVAFAEQADMSKYMSFAGPLSGPPADYTTEGLKPRTDWPGGPSGADQWKYDNNNIINAYYFYDADNVAAVMMTPTYLPSIIAQLDVHVLTNGDPYWPWPNSTNDSFNVWVWFPTNRGDQFPGVEMFHARACATGLDTATVTVPLNVGSLICYGDTFWVGMSEITAAQTGMALASSYSYYRDFVRISDVWQIGCCRIGDKIIRAWTMQLAEHDFACTGIIDPSAMADSGAPVTPRVTIMNLSIANTEVNVPVLFEMPGYSETIIIPSLGPLETKDTTFPAGFVTGRGDATVKCSTMLEGDLIPADNKCEKPIFIRIRDVQTVGIIAPNTTVDSGVSYVPMVSVRNNGTQPEGFRVRVTIVPDGYVASESVYVLQTQSALVTFDAWNPVVRGYNVLKCSTRMDVDRIHANDAATRTIRVQVLDAGAWAIIQPSGNNVPGGAISPRATVKNFGNVAGMIPAQFDIYRCNPVDTPLVYTAANSNWVVGGGSGSMTFDDWTAVGGLYIARLTTILDGDPAPANDTMSEFFFVLEAGHDVGATEILAPVGVVDPTPKTPMARVMNFGSFTETFGATYKIVDSLTGSLVYTGTALAINLEPGFTADLSFSPDWGGVHPEDRYYTTCYTAMLGDADLTNDSCHGEFMVLTVINDVGVKSIDITTPLDSGTTVTQPSATVKNYGSLTADFDVKLTIGAYTSIAHVIGLGEGAEQSVPFDPDWLAVTRGINRARCSTMLDYDIYSGNDTLSKPIMVNVHDVRAVSIDNPAGAVPPITITPRATVRNHGTLREPGTVTFEIDATPPYTSTRTLTGLPPGIDSAVEFDDWSASLGTYIAKCSLYLATDQVPGNEVISRDFEVGAVDVGVMSIQAPVNCDTGAVITPSATVRNFGELPTDFSVHFEISNALDAVVYTGDATVVGLAGNSTRTVTFPVWAKPHAVGGYRDSCVTILLGDGAPGNDFTTGSFTITAQQVSQGGWTPLAPILPGGKSKGVKDGGALATSPGIASPSQYVYALKGNNTYEFYAYGVMANTWFTRESIPAFNSLMKKKAVKKGSSLVEAGDVKLYATKGNGTYDFWKYDPDKPWGTRWSQMMDVPLGAKKVKEGVGSVAVNDGGVDYVYLLKGSATFEFYRYDVAGNVWDTSLPPAPGGTSGKPFKNGSSLTYDGGDTIYALKGSYNEFFAYSVSGKIWTTKDPLPLVNALGKKKKVKDGSGSAAFGGSVYALKGGNTNEFYQYKFNDHKWYTGPEMPTLTKRVKGGGALKAMPETGVLYAFRGNGTMELWKYAQTFGLPMSVAKENTGAMANPAAIGAQFNLRIAPNPFTSSAAISYTLPRTGNVSLKLFDVAGKLVTTLAQGYTRAGSYTTSINAARLASGIYLLKFDLDGQVTTQKLILE